MIKSKNLQLRLVYPVRIIQRRNQKLYRQAKAKRIQYHQNSSPTNAKGSSLDRKHRVQFSSVAQSCLTPCDPMNCSTPGLPVNHQLLEFTQTEVHRVGDAIQPSHPLSSASPPAPKPSQQNKKKKTEKNYFERS